MSALEGKSVVLTGAAQGLGAAIARHFHGLGAGLILLDRDGEGLAETCAACPGATSAVVDLSDVGDTEAGDRRGGDWSDRHPHPQRRDPPGRAA